LPCQKRLTKLESPKKRYTAVYVGLTPELLTKLGDLANKRGDTQSEALRHILDAYLEGISKKGLPCEPLRKTSPVGLTVTPRTIGKEQNKKLRELSEKTGRKISDLVREAVEGFNG